MVSQYVIKLNTKELNLLNDKLSIDSTILTEHLELSFYLNVPRGIKRSAVKTYCEGVQAYFRKKLLDMEGE